LFECESAARFVGFAVVAVDDQEIATALERLWVCFGGLTDFRFWFRGSNVETGIHF